MKKTLPYAFFIILMLAISFAAVKALQSPFFHISQISVQTPSGNTPERANAQAIFSAAKPFLTGSFFAVDVHNATQHAKQNEWVSNIQIQRQFPNKIKIIVEEHQPIAYWIRDGHRAGLISSEGIVFQAQTDLRLPEFDGQTDRLTQMIKQYEGFNAYLKPLRLQVQRLQYTERASWTAYLNNGIEIRLGKSHIAERLKRFIKAWPTLKQKQNSIDYIDLRYTDGYAVKYDANKQTSDNNTVSDLPSQSE